MLIYFERFHLSNKLLAVNCVYVQVCNVLYIYYLVYPGDLCELFLDIFERFGVFYVCVKIFHNVDYPITYIQLS